LKDEIGKNKTAKATKIMGIKFDRKKKTQERCNLK
jgi:hypothetical protein